MEIVAYTVVAIVLYFVSDMIVDRIEHKVGRRLEYRTVLFFGIILALALVLFALIQTFGPSATPPAQN